MRHLKNLRATEAHPCTPELAANTSRPAFEAKAEFKEWCGHPATDHVFYSMVEGRAPGLRVSSTNPAHVCHGFVADYDAPVDWDALDLVLQTAPHKPTWVTRTFSGYARLVWVFESPIPVDPASYDAFIEAVATALKARKLLAGFDEASLKPSQYFEAGEDWKRTGDPVPNRVAAAAAVKAATSAPPPEAVEIPFDRLAAKLEETYPGRWPGEFVPGARGPLFWLDDGIEREGCQVVESGVVCYSNRASKGFMSWADLFGADFVAGFEEEKMGGVLDEYWFNGKSFFKVLHNAAVSIPKEQVILELRQSGLNPRAKKGQALSEVEAALLAICNQNRVDEIAPVVFSKERVVSYNGARILNSATNRPVEPGPSGDPENWPFIHDWINQLFCWADGRPATDYFFAWLKRFYHAAYAKEFLQGQALLLVGPTNKGKSLLSNRVIAGLVGGFADASDYLSGQTKFNRDLARVPTWVIDDTTSAASFQDQRKATELIKRAVANPRMEYHAKYVDAVSLPWTGRVVMSLNMDANSVSVIPALDSSNRDKLMALRIREDSTSRFGTNAQVEGTIARELPSFARWLMDFEPPSDVVDFSRFGVVSYIDGTVANAAYDNSSRSSVAELVEFFAARYRNSAPGSVTWTGTLTEFQATLHELNGGRSVGMSHNLEFVRRGMITMEEASMSNPALRPVRSRGGGGGKLWTVSLSKKYDISPGSADEDAAADAQASLTQ